MGTIYKKAQDEKLEHQLDELLGMLEEMKGTSDEDNFETSGKEKLLNRLNEMIEDRKEEKIGADLIGTDDAGFGNTEVAARFEKDNLDLITPHMERLAAELEIEPEELLSHVLEYRIYA